MNELYCPFLEEEGFSHVQNKILKSVATGEPKASKTLLRCGVDTRKPGDHI